MGNRNQACMLTYTYTFCLSFSLTFLFTLSMFTIQWIIHHSLLLAYTRREMLVLERISNTLITPCAAQQYCEIFHYKPEGLYFQIRKEIWENFNSFFKAFSKKSYLAHPVYVPFAPLGSIGQLVHLLCLYYKK